jgi:hypothetical protein
MSARRSPAHGLAAALALLLACGGGSSATTSAATETTSTTTLTDGIDPGAPTSTTTEATTAASDDTASDSEDPTTGAPPTFCSQLDISLVAHPGVDIYGPEPRAALATFLADMVETTGARVRLLANAGTEVMLKTDCLLPLGNAADDPVLVYGEGGVVDPEAPAALECLMTALDTYEGEFDNGNFMFSGLLFPVLELEQWPAPGATGLALVLAKTDDMQDNMYAQPGLAAEAYLRMVGEQDRRRVAAFTYGYTAGKLEIFGLALSENSRHYERDVTPLAAALADWTPTARKTCEDFDFAPPFEPQPPPGCKRVDILFAIDGSGSMAAEQAALRGTDGMAPVFAEFTDALLAELTDVEDFHVGVVSSQEEVTILGTHKDFPEVPESPETDCGLPPGQRWLVGPSPTLAEDFACIAATRSGTDEVTAYNTAEALHNPANAGFLRDDSLVFAVMLTDEDTYDHNIARMVDIRARLLEAVNGDLDRLIVLGIAGGQGVFEAPETICEGPYGLAVPARRMASIVASLRERGRMQNICGGDLSASFAAVLGDVVSACLAYNPTP